jgi:hypothetical protein
MTNLTRIVAVIVDTKKAILYKQDGTTIEMLQGDKRLRPLLEQVTPLLATQKYADVDLSTENTWKEFEAKSNSAVRLFRVAKSKLASLFRSDEVPSVVAPQTVGTLPVVAPTRSEQAIRNMAAVNEILKHAVPVAAAEFDETKVAAQRPVVEGDKKTPTDRSENGSDQHHDKHEDTIVAITPKGGIVAGMERIKSQFAAAAKQGDAKGLTIFLERLAAVRNQRQHTPDELLRFMERGDLPIANDGTIIIYKRLERRGDGYVDVHSRKVTQRVGSYVHMDPSLVDHNRRNECSNGLHVARRGYINGFSGDVVVLAKVRPEDVIAVPNYDANKMRVCGYHIIAELTQMQFKAIVENRPISDAEGGEELLGQAIAGNHIGITEMVKICGQNSTNIKITEIVTGEEPVDESDTESEVQTVVSDPAEIEALAEELKDVAPAPKPPVKKVAKTISKKAKKAKRKVAVKKATTAVKKATPLEAAQIGRGDVPVDVRAVNKLKAGNDQALKLEVKGPITQTELVTGMWDEALAGKPGKAQELLDFKKKAKKGWTVWGLPENAGETLKALLS